ncbi:hypothetical protein [Chondromyces apiculatus]|nr:hypothetical protein [Chondromyces apiculatus]
MASLAGFAFAVAVVSGCEDAVPSPATPDGGAGAGGTTVGDGGLGDAANDGDVTLPDAADAGVAAVIIGITPSPRASGDAPPGQGEQLDAVLTTFAAGVRGAMVRRTLSNTGPEAAAELTGVAQRYAANGKQVLFNLALAERAADGRPAELSTLAWDDPVVISAVHDAVDLVLDTFGDSLAYLTFGSEVDIYLTRHPEQRPDFEALALEACAYATQHPDAPPALRTGVGFSMSSASAPTLPLTALREAGEVAAFTYLPGVADGAAAPTSDVAGALDRMIVLADGRPVVLQATGYPSAESAGGTRDKQRLFFSTLAEALAPRRAAFPFVNVVELNDPAPAACDSRVSAQGEAPDGPFEGFACSLGLFDLTGSEKPAWGEVAAIAATFASP